jgi:hypothetical protein
MFSVITSLVRWAARISAIFIAATLLIFATGEPIGSLSVIPGREWAGIALLLSAILAMLVAWKWELPAALVSLFALIAFAAVVRLRSLEVLAIAMVPDVLFLLDWRLRHLHYSPLSKPR